MIRSIRHKALKRPHEKDDVRGLTVEHVIKLRDMLARLDAAGTVEDMDVPGFRLHPLKAGLFSAFRKVRRWTLIILITTERKR